MKSVIKKQRDERSIPRGPMLCWQWRLLGWKRWSVICSARIQFGLANSTGWTTRTMTKCTSRKHWRRCCTETTVARRRNHCHDFSHFSLQLGNHRIFLYQQRYSNNIYKFSVTTCSWFRIYCWSLVCSSSSKEHRHSAINQESMLAAQCYVVAMEMHDGTLIISISSFVLDWWRPFCGGIVNGIE